VALCGLVCLCSSLSEKLDLDFPNLPYYLEPNAHAAASIQLTQSTTILRHLARKHNLIGADLKEQANCDLIFDTAYDFKSILVDTAYSRQRAEALAHFAAKTVPHYFGQFEAFFVRNKSKWSAGQSLTIADMFLFEMLDQSMLMVPGCLDGYTSLKQFVGNFAALPAIVAYRASPHYIDRPLNNMAGFQ
jgi:glutathione S-transferase